MILVGSQRGGARQLTDHLLNRRDNEHVAVQELRGFMADDLHGALAEAHAISKATRCTQFMFSLSLNPPKGVRAGIDDLIDAADRAESALGLDGQPRAIIVHEKEGRRHAHVVWSRIDGERLKAINMPHFKNRLAALSRDLYLDHGWDLPDGHKTNGWKNPLNFTLAEWQQAKRLGLDPREVKQVFVAAWERSDSLRGLRHALEEHGYFLARGDRRGFVALDIQGELFSLSRWAGVKSKELRARLGEGESLPGVDAMRLEIKRRMTERLRDLVREDRRSQAEELEPLMQDRAAMVAMHRAERERLQEGQDKRHKAETKARAARLHGGMRGVWELLTGKLRAVRLRNEVEAFRCFRRDRDQRESLFVAQMSERERLQADIDAIRIRHREDRMRLTRRIVGVLRHGEPETAGRAFRRRRDRSFHLDFDR